MDSFLSSSSGSAEERLSRAAGSQRLPQSLFVEFRLYITVGLLLGVVATYAIVAHLIHDLLHDLADWVFGPNTEAGDAESGREEERVRMEEERAGLLPGFNTSSAIISQDPAFITSL